MTNTVDKFNKRRLRSSYLSVIVSMSLVLFMLGALGMIGIYAKSVSVHFKENLNFTVVLKNNAKEVDVRKFHKKLELSEYIKSTEFISKEEAAEDLKAITGEDFMEALEGVNPLSDAISIHFKSEHTNSERLLSIEKELLEQEVVNNILYDKVLVYKLTSNIRKLSIILLAVSGFLCLIAVALINSSIRLAIYSKRFTIKTMQLVGATKSFIQRPFIFKSISHGLYGSLVAISLLYVTYHYVKTNIPLYNPNQDLLMLVLTVGIIISGLFISWICTYFAVRKYLKLKTDQLYN